MNPPFKGSDQHVRHALRLLPDDGTLAALLRMNWRAAKRRADLLPHVRLEVILERLKMLPPGAVDRGHGGTTDFSWFVFGRQPVEATRVIRGHKVTCETKDTDRYGRTVAICRADGRDLGADMVRAGMALAFVRYSRDYVEQERSAKAERLGIHARACEAPWDWRARQRLPP